MDNFGVVEIASAKTTNAPGWAYVPDTPALHNPAPAPSGNRKRAARNQTGGAHPSASDLSASQEAKIRKELEALDRDCWWDANVAIPVRNAASRAQSKHTPNVRKILLSQKTFANHLDDFLATAALTETQPSHPNQYTSTSAKPQSSHTPSSNARRASMHKKSTDQLKHKRGASYSATAGAGAADVQMLDSDAIEQPSASSSSLLTPLPPSLGLPPHPEDSNPLLVSRVPEAPTDEELRRLLAAPPLSYLDAAARWPEDEGGVSRYPVRHFCEICGYFARAKCRKCGGRVCALECLETHRQDCITRYGL